MLGGTSGHAFFPGFDTYSDGVPLHTVDVEYACTYGGHEAFTAKYRLIFYGGR
jgi:hypothetical protein